MYRGCTEDVQRAVQGMYRGCTGGVQGVDMGVRQKFRAPRLSGHGSLNCLFFTKKSNRNSISSYFGTDTI